MQIEIRISWITGFAFFLPNPKKELQNSYRDQRYVVRRTCAFRKVIMADQRQRALPLLLLLFQEFFDDTLEDKLQQMGNEQAVDCQLLLLLVNSRFRRNRARIPGYFEQVVPSYSPYAFPNHFCMSRRSVSFLEGLLGACLEIPHKVPGRGGKPPVELRKQTLIFVRSLANPECMRYVSARFDISISTCYECIDEYALRLLPNWREDLSIFRKVVMQGRPLQSLRKNGDFPGY